MEYPINISTLNDFIFCPASIYFHGLYGAVETSLYQRKEQINGSHAHRNIDNAEYSTSSAILQGMNVYSERYNLIGKIDLFYTDNGILVERKKKVSKIYDGYVFQLYAQCFALMEMGYEVKRLKIHSLDDNRNYDIKMPCDDEKMLEMFEGTVKALDAFELETFEQKNEMKCRNCIYEPYCDRSLI